MPWRWGIAAATTPTPGRRSRAAGLGPEDEAWEIVALEYQAADGWIICDECSNFCGLVPPNLTLAAFEQGSLCRYQHEASRTPGPPCT